ncbi:MAG: hypothetical protein GF353_11170, partial [Candidatus Lokiarchaeota archaeon]|nr:hypothetical protein [Candidatus Lokiarchaeota archaeon]
MGENHFLILKAEIRDELNNLNRLSKECKEFAEVQKINLNSPESLRVFGSILHDFYTCIEKIFRKIALNIDEE